LSKRTNAQYKNAFEDCLEFLTAIGDFETGYRMELAFKALFPQMPMPN